VLSTDADTGVITYDTTSGIVAWEFEYEKTGVNNDGADDREECDFGAYNSPNDLASTTYDDVRMYACSSDCKLTENKFIDDPTTYPDESEYLKWDCSISMTEVAWALDIKNATRVVYMQTCNYLCGNQFLNIYEADGVTELGADFKETCDIGGWSHLSMTTDGWFPNADAGGTAVTVA